MPTSLTYESLNTLDVWQRMGSITLSQMRSVKLMNRIDTKYVLSYDEVLQLIEAAASHNYYVQIIDKVRACRYRTLYYDTAEREMFRQHHNRKLCRQKLRTRTYVESNTTFFEIKEKSNRGRTKKRREEIASENFANFGNDPRACALLEAHTAFALSDVSPALTTSFTRITLVNPTLSERITIDLDLEYTDVRSKHSASIDRMAIVELKQDGNITSLTKRLLRDMRIPPLKVSKYCLGTTLTVDNIKRNRFKEKLQEINKRLNRSNYDNI